MLASRRSRSVLLVALSAALTVPLLGLPGVAAAEDAASTGDTVVGTLVQAWPEYEDHTEAAEHAGEGPLSWVEPDVGDAVRVATEDVEDIATGATVEVELGKEVADTAADEGMAPAREVLAAEVLEAAPAAPADPADPPLAEALPPSWITNQVTVVMVVPAGGVRDATTLAEVVAAVDGPVADFWSGESRTSVGVGVAAQHDWPVTPYTASCSSPTALWNEAQTKSGFVPGPGKHLMLYLPRNTPGCAYGLAEVRQGITSGGRLYVTDTKTSLIAHELGHNFSLGHSSALQCDGEVDLGSCRIAGYADYYDVMGGSWDEVGSLNAVHAAGLGFLDPWTPEWEGYLEVHLGSSPQQSLHRYWVQNSNYRALKVLGAADGAVYWLEFRTAEGPDVWLGDPVRNVADLQAGVLLRREVLDSDPTAGDDESYLLDGTPSAASGWDSDLQSALPVGTPVRVEGGGFTVTVQSVAGGEANLLVEGDPAAPTFPRDWTGEGDADLLAADKAGGLQLYPGSGTGGFLARQTIGSSWTARDQLLMSGDWDGDTFHDLIARNPSNGDLWLYRGNGAGGFVDWRVIGVGWNVMDALFSPGDWDGDGYADLLARQRSDGALFLYPGNGRGEFGARSRVGIGWNVMTDFATAGDWDGNGVVDLLARDNSGYLHLYSGTGTGTFVAGRRTIGVGWQIFPQITGPGDWNGDGHPDLLAQGTDGALFLYPGSGTGTFLARKQIGSGWTGFRLPD